VGLSVVTKFSQQKGYCLCQHPGQAPVHPTRITLSDYRRPEGTFFLNAPLHADYSSVDSGLGAWDLAWLGCSMPISHVSELPGGA
jgi:hypothetical protein